MTASPPEPDGNDDVPEIPDFIPDEGFVASGPKEPSAEERAAKAARIAQGNDRLRAAGQISDGTGKPAYRRGSKVAPWIGIAAAVAVLIVVVAVLAG
jgi:hypothetical protein